MIFKFLIHFCFNEAIKPSHQCSAWHVLRDEHLPLVTFVVEMFRTDYEVLQGIFFFFFVGFLGSCS